MLEAYINMEISALKARIDTLYHMHLHTNKPAFSQACRLKIQVLRECQNALYNMLETAQIEKEFPCD